MAGLNNDTLAKRNKKFNNYFDRNIEKSGELFLDLKNAKDIYYDVPSIFRQLAKGQIDIAQYGHFFLEKNFLKNCIDACSRRARFECVSYCGCDSLIREYIQIGNPISQDMYDIMNIHKKTMDAYNLIVFHLNQLLETGSLQCVYNLAQDLNAGDYKYFLS